MNIARFIRSAVLGAVAAFGFSAGASASTVLDVEVLGGFVDPFAFPSAVSDTGLNLTGTITVDETSLAVPGEINVGDITAYSLTTSGSTVDGALFDHTWSFGSAAVSYLGPTSGAEVDLSDGTMAEMVGMSFSDGDFFLDLNFDTPGAGAGFFTASVYNLSDPNFLFLTSDELTIDGERLVAPIIPLPASLPVLLGALGLMGIVARRRKA